MKVLKIIVITVLCAALVIPLSIGGLMAALTVVGTIFAWLTNPAIMGALLLIGIFIVLPIVVISRLVK
jgi:hypothetical protein